MVSQEEIDFWLNSTMAVALDCVEIYHPSFTKTYYFVRNAEEGVSVKHEDGKSVFYEYCPLLIQLSNSSENLDQSLTIGIGEIDDTLPKEILNLRNGDYNHIVPILNYRVYSSNNLNTPLKVITGLEIVSAKRKKDAVVFTAKVKNFNSNETGVKYTLNNFPSLQGFI